MPARVIPIKGLPTLEQLGDIQAIAKELKSELRGLEKEANKAVEAGRQVDTKTTSRITEIKSYQDQVIQEKQVNKVIDKRLGQARKIRSIYGDAKDLFSGKLDYQFLSALRDTSNDLSELIKNKPTLTGFMKGVGQAGQIGGNLFLANMVGKGVGQSLGLGEQGSSALGIGATAASAWFQRAAIKQTAGAAWTGLKGLGAGGAAVTMASVGFMVMSHLKLWELGKQSEAMAANANDLIKMGGKPFAAKIEKIMWQRSGLSITEGGKFAEYTKENGLPYANKLFKMSKLDNPLVRQLANKYGHKTYSSGDFDSVFRNPTNANFDHLDMTLRYMEGDLKQIEKIEKQQKEINGDPEFRMRNKDRMDTLKHLDKERQESVASYALL